MKRLLLEMTDVDGDKTFRECIEVREQDIPALNKDILWEHFETMIVRIGYYKNKYNDTTQIHTTEG